MTAEVRPRYAAFAVGSLVFDHTADPLCYTLAHPGHRPSGQNCIGIALDGS
jgi:hypothetical protein